MDELGMSQAGETPGEFGAALKYKGYTGSVEYEPGDGVFYGSVNDITDIVTYQSEKAEGPGGRVSHLG